MSTRLGRALRGVSVVFLWALLAWPALAQVRNEGAIPDGRGGVGALTLGAHHTCGIRQDGTAMCWGDNWYDEAKPLPGAFIELSAGFSHTCGLRGDGSVACWGSGYAPPPDQSMPPPSPVPSGVFTTLASSISTTCGLRARALPWEYPEGNVVCWNASGWQLPAPPSGDFVALSVGNDFTCALRANGKPACWGYIPPEQVPVEETFIAISAGGRHACGLRADGSVRCWGDDWAGQASAPAELFTAISAGAFNTCGLRPDGTVLCWGENQSGQSSPPPDRFVAVTAGETHACGLRPDGHVACWGYVNWNYYPEPPSPYTPPPPPQETVFGMGQLAAGDWHDCQVNAEGLLTCWGGFDREPASETRFSAVSSGQDATCARDETGHLRCFGGNQMVTTWLPFEPLRQFDLGYEHACGVSALDGSPKCWGRETNGKTLPPEYPPGQLFRNTSAGLMHSCGVTAEGLGTCWGYNGDGETYVPSLPPEVGYISVEAGERHSCGLDGGLRIFCWGMSPQPFDPNSPYDPNNPPDFPTFRALSVGAHHSCAIRTNGRLLCWGENWSGQLQAPEGTFVAVSAGRTHTCAIRTDGSRVCWGEPWLTPHLVLDPDRLPELRPGQWLDVPFQLRSESPYQLREPRYAIVAGTLPMGFWFAPDGRLLGSSNEPGRYPITVEGRDRDGFTARRDLVLSIDNTPPVIEPQIIGTLGENGWYTSAVSLTWSITDPESEVLGRYGCEPATVDHDTWGDVFYCDAASVGGPAHQEVVIRVDRLPPPPPQLTASALGISSHFYFWGDDATSGVGRYECSLDNADYSPCTPQLDLTVAAGKHELRVRTVDGAGLAGDPAVQEWWADATPPEVLPAYSGTLGQNGWLVSDAQILWSVVDNESPIWSRVGCNNVMLTTDTIGASFTCTATSAGGTGKYTATYKRDATPPDTSFTGTLPVTGNDPHAVISFTGQDATSGVQYYECRFNNEPFAECGSGLEFFSVPGQQTFEVRAVDRAGNRDPTPANHTWFIDTTPPAIASTVTGTLGYYGWYVGDVQVSWSVSDPNSSVTSISGCNSVTLNGDTIGAELVCTATSTGGAASKTVSIKRDTTPPDTAIDAAPAAQVGSTTATFEFAGSDAASGVRFYECSIDGASYNLCTSPRTYDVTPGAHTFAVRTMDTAGHRDPAPATYAWTVDLSPPDISLDVNGNRGASDWYVSDVQVDWDVSDAGSTITSAQGCDDLLINTDTIGLDLACTAASAGGSASRSLSIRRDTVAPETTLTSAPGAEVGGRNASFAFTGTDAMAGVVAYECDLDGQGYVPCTSPYSYTGLPVGAHRFQVRAVDGAGHRDATPDVHDWRIDLTAPVIQPTVSGTLGSNGWRVGDVQVTWAVSEPDSTVATVGCTDVALTTDTSGASFTCTATSAGGTATRTVTVKRDATAPQITAAAETAPSAAGWYRSDVSVSFTCSDATSGGVVCPTAQVVTGEGSALASSARSVTDAAGNSAVSNVVTVKIDRTAPTLAPTVTPGTVQLNGTANAMANGTDARSGIAVQSCATLATGSIGDKTVACSATDRAGNTASAAAGYRVVYGFVGFSSPVQNPSTLNVIKAGRSVPLRWRVLDAQGVPVTNLAAATVTATAISCPSTAENRIYTYGGSSSQLQNLGNGYYQLDWAAAGSLRGYCRRLELNLGDGEVHPALFKFN